MKYRINKKHKFSTKNNRLKERLVLTGFLLPSRSKKFVIQDEVVTNICLVNKKLAHPFVSKIVFKKYDKLIKVLTELFVSEDDDDTTMDEVLNRIEKFREEIKRKYRYYLKKKELEEMSLRLRFFQRQAKERQMEAYFTFREKSSSRSR